MREADVRTAAKAHLAPYRRPKSYLPAEDLAHTATGKLIHRDVPGHLGLNEG